jgi:hypothetical protein
MQAKLRSFLNDQKVRVPNTRGKSISRPQCADPEAVQKYEADKEGGPNKDKVLMAWYQPLSSASLWNWDAITILAEKAQTSLKSSQTKFDDSWLQLSELMKQIVVSLKETKKIMAEPSTSSSRTMTVQHRRRYRKVTVSISSHEHITIKQSLKCRRSVIDIR